MVSKNVIGVFRILGILLVVGCNSVDEIEQIVEEEESVQDYSGELVIEEPGYEDKGLTKEEVALHDTTGDCWIIFGGEVYDISSFISNHQGRNVMHEGCGREATELYILEKMGYERIHTALGRLQDYWIGEIS